MQAAVAVGLWILDVVLFLHQDDVIGLDHQICQAVNIIRKGTDHADACHVGEIFPDALYRDGISFPVQLFINAFGGFQTALDGLKGIPVVLLGKFFVKDLELCLDHHDGAAVLHHQVVENLGISQLAGVEPDDLALLLQSPCLLGDGLRHCVFAGEEFYDIVYPFFYNGAVKGLVDKIRNAQLEAIVFNLYGSFAAYDQDGDDVDPLLVVHPVQDRIAVCIGHLQIQKKGRDAALIFLQLLDGLRTVLRCLYDIILHQHIMQYLAVDLHVICD